MAMRKPLSQKDVSKARKVVYAKQQTARGKLAKDKKTDLKGKKVNAMHQTAKGTTVKMKGQKKVCHHLSSPQYHLSTSSMQHGRQYCMIIFVSDPALC